jgi:hypothetical protein
VRSGPTDEEMVAGEALRSRFEADGIQVTGFEHSDRPDLRMNLDGVPYGIELVQIPSKKIMQLVHSRIDFLHNRAGKKVVQLVWPIEPDYWVKTAIEDKQKKLGAYRKRVGSERVSLLIHTPAKGDIYTLSSKEEVELMQSAANHTSHGFDAIYFWDAASKADVRDSFYTLYPCPFDVPRRELDVSHGYPTDSRFLYSKSVTTPNEGTTEHTEEFSREEIGLILMHPENPTWRSAKPHFRTPRRIGYRVTATPNAITPAFMVDWEECDS